MNKQVSIVVLRGGGGGANKICRLDLTANGYVAENTPGRGFRKRESMESAAVIKV